MNDDKQPSVIHDEIETAFDEIEMNGNQPETTFDEVEMNGSQPEALLDKPEVHDDQPEATSDEPEMNDDDQPEATSDEPEMNDDDQPEAASDEPEMNDDDQPETASDEPEVHDDDQPETASDDESVIPAAEIREVSPLAGIDLENLVAREAVGKLIQHASSLSASDIYFSWDENEIGISLRYLGILKRLVSIPTTQAGRLINYIKSVSGMNLAQKLRPLDGRTVWEFDDGKKIDLRISTIPTLFGEDMTVHLLEREDQLLELDNLGLFRRDLNALRTLVNGNSGLVLVTGPTGGGKTTTLYACIHQLNNGTRKINTIEDPVEYVLPGVRQSQINPVINLDFPELLRSVLRQAPDVIMVGEIRDPVTAKTAVRAAASGHLVFATLHAPTAAAGIDSMLALEVQPHFLATGLDGVITQRLLRKLCEHCRIGFDLGKAPEMYKEVQHLLRPGQGEKAYAPAGCEKCLFEGYMGRTGTFEVLQATREIRQMITEKRAIRQIHEKAVANGMIDLQRAAMLKVADGITSLEEVLRVIPKQNLFEND